MNICRFKHGNEEVRIGLVRETTVLDLTAGGLVSMQALLESDDPVGEARELCRRDLPSLSLSQVTLCAPIERQEVWAAGVTYLRSKSARIEESDFSATAYDRVYQATRPELFFKSPAEKVVPHGEPIGIRQDAQWSVPEPELALVLNSRGQIVACTIGNDMSSRDIEGENLLYLPQAKIYHRSCALGPWLCLGVTEAAARQWSVHLEILREGRAVFTGDTYAGQIKRGFEELAGFLYRSQKFPNGAVLLTGTGIVPGADFTLREGDVVRIGISGIGTLENPVLVV
jgi:2-dehydro-3-deoxy-D-arabinonate dehydratase